MQGFPSRSKGTFDQQEIGNELLLYNEETHRAFSLNPTAAAVWKRCDGRTSADEMVRALRVTQVEDITLDVVELALEGLERDGLIDPLDELVEAGMSRRDLVTKFGLRAAILLPFVAAIAVPAAANAYTGCVDC